MLQFVVSSIPDFELFLLLMCIEWFHDNFNVFGSDLMSLY